MSYLVVRTKPAKTIEMLQEWRPFSPVFPKAYREQLLIDLQEVDRSIEEAAMDLGCTPLKTFFVVTLPVITPALASGWLLAFTLSLDDLVIASFVSGPGATTLPMMVFSSVRMGVSPKINALATLIILAVSLVAFIAWYIMRRNEKRRRSGRLS